MSGFGVRLVITPDADWAAKWETPSDTTPYFSEATEVRRGGRLTILTFFANPLPNASGEVDVRCDLKITRPDGSLSLDAKNVVCMSGVLQGPLANVRLSAPIIAFVAETGDQAGSWQVDIVVQDSNRGVKVPVHASFVLRD